jgi:predicted TIM-barrel fold metal-dependent hydrolase
MIDMHLHAVNPRLPGVRAIPEFLEGPPDAVAAVLAAQMRESGMEALLGMGHLAGSDDDPLGIASTLRIAEFLPALYAIGVADPSRTGTDHLQRVERQLQSGSVKALKGYLGYLYYGPEHPAYTPYYELAARYQVPFIFHTGDNYSDVAKVKYAHPLFVDEVAVDHRGVNFVMAHFGNPWITDAAEVVYKNENVWADLSGLLVGDGAVFEELAQRGTLSRTVERIQHGIEYTGRPDKFLYGSDWPLAPMRVYRDFVSQIFPDEFHDAVFRDNAKRLFKL